MHEAFLDSSIKAVSNINSSKIHKHAQETFWTNMPIHEAQISW